jgi:hypothetical protein
MRALRTLGTAAGAAVLSLLPLAALAESYATVRNIRGEGYLQATQGAEPQGLTLNSPVLPGDGVWTSRTGMVDLFLADGNHVWMDSDTRADLDKLPGDEASDEKILRLRLWKGSLLLDLRVCSPECSYLVTTPSATVGPLQEGLYYVEVESVDRTRVAAMQGLCTVASAGESVRLAAYQMTYAEYGYPPTAPVNSQVSAAALLGFRESCLPARSAGSSAKYLPSSLDAYAPDLDANGTWMNTAEYGYVWRPNAVPADWAPYTNGRWVYNPWGMTWVPYEVWGWAPFHYGRWIFSAGFGWGWCPMPYFAPAWVSFWWGDDGWLGWCPMGYYGSPLWGPCGWYSVPVAYIYDPIISPIIVRHRNAPPPRPIYPIAKGSPAVLEGGGPRGSVSRVGSLNLPPSRVRDLRDGKISAREVGSGLLTPVNPRRSYPSILPQPGGREGRGEPQAPAGGLEPRGRGNRTEPSLPVGRVEPGAGQSRGRDDGWKVYPGLPSRPSGGSGQDSTDPGRGAMIYPSDRGGTGTQPSSRPGDGSAWTPQPGQREGRSGSSPRSEPGREPTSPYEPAPRRQPQPPRSEPAPSYEPPPRHQPPTRYEPPPRYEPPAGGEPRGATPRQEAPQPQPRYIPSRPPTGLSPGTGSSPPPPAPHRKR